MEGAGRGEEEAEEVLTSVWLPREVAVLLSTVALWPVPVLGARTLHM